MNTVNPFIEVLKKANENNWCIKYFCTTCGARDFRRELKIVGGVHGDELFMALKVIDPQQLIEIDNWQDAVLIALSDMPFMNQREEILKEWMPIDTNNLAFTDFIVFKAIEFLPKENETRQKWINKCVDFALETRDFSLTESLVLQLKNDAKNYPGLLAIAKEYAKSSFQMNRVLVNTNNRRD